MSAESNKAVVRRFFDLYLAKNDDEAEKLFDPRILVHQPGMADLDSKAFRKLGEDYRTAFPDGKFTLDDLIAEGDRVVARLTYRGTNRGPIMGMPATNRQVVNPGVWILRFSPEGKVAEVWTEYDQLSMMIQLGLMKAPQAMSQ